MTIGERILQLRLAKGWSRKKLALRSGVTRTHLLRIERQVSVPSLHVAKAIADALDVTIDALLSR